MSVKELIAELSRYDKDAQIKVEMRIDGVEYDATVSETYNSGDIYIYADFGKSSN